MPYNILYTEKYKKKIHKFFKSHPEIFLQYSKTIKILEINPHHPSLRLHKLKGALQGIHSVSINMNYRVTIDFVIEDKKIIPLDIGSHDGIYN